MLLSRNNRPLGRSGRTFPTVAACRDAVQVLRVRHQQLNLTATTDPSGHWHWRADLDGITVAVSSRTYLRQQECDYNLRRFLEAVPIAETAEGVRIQGGKNSGTKTALTHSSGVHSL